DLNRVGRSAARFDFAKLENLNGLYIRQAPDAELVEAMEKFLPELPDGGALLPRFKALRDRIAAIMPGLKERAKTLVELVDGARFLFEQRPLKLNDKARAILTPEARKLLKVAIPALEKTEWNGDALDRDIRLIADNENVKLAAVAQPLRAALTGRSTSTGIFDVLVALGKEESLARLRDQAGVTAAV